MRDDHTISLGNLAAIGAWVVTVALLTVAIVLYLPMLAMAALVFSMVAATATIRTFFVRHEWVIRGVFEAARESGPVRQMRS